MFDSEDLNRVLFAGYLHSKDIDDRCTMTVDWVHLFEMTQMCSLGFLAPREIKP